MTSATPKPRAGEHTPAPWYSDQDGFIYTERDDEDQIVVAKAHEHPRMNATLMNARRIVACVNYCEGIATSFLEGASIGQPVFPEAERDLLRERERELVEALKAAELWLSIADSYLPNEHLSNLNSVTGEKLQIRGARETAREVATNARYVLTKHGR